MALPNPNGPCELCGSYLHGRNWHFHPTATKQRCQYCGGDHASQDCPNGPPTNPTTPHPWAEQRDARRNQPITRGEILDAIDAALRVMNSDHMTLRALRRAFE